MIESKSFRITNKDFFQLLMERHLRERWWLYALFISMAVFHGLKPNKIELDWFFLIFFIFYPLVFVLQIYRHAYSKANKIFFEERYFQIDTKSIKAFMKNGSESTVTFDNLIKKGELKTYFLLYIAKNQFIFIPKSCFKSEQDKAWFVQNVMK